MLCENYGTNLQRGKRPVLILVLMEDALRDVEAFL